VAVERGRARRPRDRRICRGRAGRRHATGGAELLRRRHGGRRPGSGVLAEAVERVPRQHRRRHRDRRAIGLPGVQRAVRQSPGVRSFAGGAGRTGGAEPDARRHGRRPHRRRGTHRVGERRIGVSAAPRRGRGRGHRARGARAWGGQLALPLRRVPPRGQRRHPSKAIVTHFDRIGHVQIADAPGRNEPGTGRLDIDGYLRQLDALGYRGWVGLEYKPSGATTDSFAWLPADRRSTDA